MRQRLTSEDQYLNVLADRFKQKCILSPLQSRKASIQTGVARGVVASDGNA
jgi:hypothetical protein